VQEYARPRYLRSPGEYGSRGVGRPLGRPAQTVAKAQTKRVCYLSVEFLPGPALLNALSGLKGQSLGVARPQDRQITRVSTSKAIIAEEHDPGSERRPRAPGGYVSDYIALQYPAVGYGIRYDYGIFTQVIEPDGAQREIGSSSLRLRDPCRS
jgi:starch phosphorylase